MESIPLIQMDHPIRYHKAVGAGSTTEDKVLNIPASPEEYMRTLKDNKIARACTSILNRTNLITNRTLMKK